MNSITDSGQVGREQGRTQEGAEGAKAPPEILDDSTVETNIICSDSVDAWLHLRLHACQMPQLNALHYINKYIAWQHDNNNTKLCMP